MSTLALFLIKSSLFAMQRIRTVVRREYFLRYPPAFQLNRLNRFSVHSRDEGTEDGRRTEEASNGPFEFFVTRFSSKNTEEISVPDYPVD